MDQVLGPTALYGTSGSEIQLGGKKLLGGKTH